MAYQLVASESTVHVLGPTEVIDAVRATVVTPTHSVVAATIVPATIWGTAAGVSQLDWYAHGIEEVLLHSAAIAGVGTQSLDANGLLQHNVTFTVGYTPPGSTSGPLTVEVDVPNPLLETPGVLGTPDPGTVAALQIIAHAEAGLRLMAGG